MIRSSAHTLKYTNRGKREDIGVFITEYRRLLQAIIDDVWESGIPGYRFIPQTGDLEVPSFLPNDYLKTFDSWFTARMKQCVGKQACAMLRAASEKRRKQYWKLAELQREGEDTKYLQRAIDTKPLVKPNASNANPELDPRFVDFQESREFDLFVRIKTIGNGMTFNLPIRYTKVSNRWMKRGELKKSIRLMPDTLVLIYDVKDTKPFGNKVVGCDQGYRTVAVLSDGQETTEGPHGHTLESIQTRLARRQSGSNGFARAQAQRENYINWSLNQLDWTDIREVRLEEIKHLRTGRRQVRLMTHWTYTVIKQKLERLSETEGFRLVEVPNEFRSQRCSECGWVHKDSRKGKTFVCVRCGFTKGADRNAASNLELDLYEVPYWVRRCRLNRKGFYWKPDGIYDVGHESIVRDTHCREKR